MASKALLIAMVIAAVAAPPALATDYMVGDEVGWTLDTNYTTWTQGKDFRVGDKILFMYNNQSHNVAIVNESDFLQCKETNTSEVLTTGNDTITLATPGKKWYICSVIIDHCSKGMKLVINVAAAEVPTTRTSAEVSPMNSLSGFFKLIRV